MATIYKRGKRWQAQIRRHGYPPLTRSFRTKADAERWVRDQEAEMDRGEWVDTREAARTTLADALERYQREVIPRKKSQSQERGRVRVWLRSGLQDYALTNLRGADVARWRDDRLEDISSGTVRRDLALLSHLYTVARSEWRMEGLRDPTEPIWWPSPGQARDRRLQPDEERRLREHAQPQFEALLTVALETGMRRGELAAMRWSDVDLRGRVVRVPDSKTGDPREVPLSRAAVAALESIPRRIDGAVWPWCAEGIGTTWKRLRRASGVDGFTFHDLRHEATSRLVESGRFSLTEVSAITGHKSMQTLRRYANHRAADLVRKLDQG